MNTSAALLKRALNQIDALIAVTTTESQHDPTPCDEYDVTALIDHLVVIANRITAAAAHGGHHGVPADTDWTGAAAHARAAIDDADPEAIADLPLGQMPFKAALATYVGELTTHGWDLAAALDRRDLLGRGPGRGRGRRRRHAHPRKPSRRDAVRRGRPRAGRRSGVRPARRLDGAGSGIVVSTARLLTVPPTIVLVGAGGRLRRRMGVTRSRPPAGTGRRGATRTLHRC